VAEARVTQFLGQVEYGIEGPLVVSQFLGEIEYGVVAARLYQFLGQAEYSDIPDTSFDIAKEKLEGRARLSLYISEPIEADKIISKINAAACTYLMSDFFGKYRYIVYELPIGYAGLSLREDEIFSVKESTDASEVVSQVRGKFRYRTLTDYWQIVIHNRTSSQYLRNSPIPLQKEWEVPFAERNDAWYAAQQVASYEGEPYREYKMTVSKKALQLLPADFVNVNYMRRGIAGMFEVLEVRPNLDKGAVELIARTQRGLTFIALPVPGEEPLIVVPPGTTIGQPGFWVRPTLTDPTTPKFPGSMGAGEIDPWESLWTAEQKQWARENAGFWTTDAGFADGADAESAEPSTWQ